MSAQISSRRKILDRVRTATSDARPEKIQRRYMRSAGLAVAERIRLMVERLREYDAEVSECAPEQLAPSIADRLRACGRHRFGAPPGLPSEWLAPGFEWMIDNGLSHEQIEQCDGVVTAAFAGVADSGTIVLHHSVTEGRRVLTLLPDWHLCILRAGQIVDTLPAYFDQCSQPPALATYISGPSATADIEMTRIKGVHGPRFLNVILVHDRFQSTTPPDPTRAGWQS